ncbi:MAG: DUF3368 domain-containing protein [Chloroflexi bacterium]|nr:DUF3368 domain-containing protein [Chloroflexota bacterium]MBI5053574.1 DUF3368 domain-containing protein [Chloroflexota bacterium]MBI5081751.1 DUF3368 domain-containing protein [Chloroflexota bacterium]MBI5350838.1 DUF3368 domain-containing protein [Chloroflexota bacterium]MBI5714339.1 DUF3368 domain-containing protein [Chloroflexota bacterium]
MPNVVSNTGPILALANVEQFDLLRQLYSKVFIPPAVRAEVKDDISLAAITSANWITIQTVKDELAVNLLREELDPGESEAIILAKELSADLVLIDDRAARRKAQSVGLNVIGTLGILLLGKQNKHITLIQPTLNRLRERGFRMSNDLYEQVLKDASETKTD